MHLVLRRFMPHFVLVFALLIALTAGGVGLAMTLGGHSQAKRPPVVLHWANEGVSDLLTLDPAIGFDLNSRQAAQLIYGGLVRFGPSYQILPDLAVRWSISDGGRTYTFYLRPHTRFGDGSEATAADVAFSFNRTLSPQFAQHSGAFLLSDIQGAALVSDRGGTAGGIQVLGRYLLRIRLLGPTSAFLSKLATPAGYVVSSRAVRRDPAHWDRRAFGTGPFRVARWVHNSSIFLEGNPYYWRGKLRIEGVDMPFIPEPLAAYRRYRAGSVDIMGTVQFPTQALYDVRGQSDFHHVSRPETFFLTLNERRAPFNQVLVREAFARAINKAALARDVYASFAHPTNVMVPPGIPGYDPSIPGVGYNPVAAQRLLARAGYPGGRGLPPIVYAVDQDAQHLALATEVAARWRRVLGVEVKAVQYSHTLYLQLLDRRTYQVAGIDWTYDYPDPANFVTQQLHSSSPNNNGGWSNHTFDRLTDLAASLNPSDPRRLALYHRAESLAMRQAATIPLVNPLSGILLRPGVHGLQITGGQLVAADWTKVTATSGSSS